MLCFDVVLNKIHIIMYLKTTYFFFKFFKFLKFPGRPKIAYPPMSISIHIAYTYIILFIDYIIFIEVRKLYQNS
jgi:hypothetical protein